MSWGEENTGCVLVNLSGGYGTSAAGAAKPNVQGSGIQLQDEGAETLLEDWVGALKEASLRAPWWGSLGR